MGRNIAVGIATGLHYGPEHSSRHSDWFYIMGRNIAVGIATGLHYGPEHSSRHSDWLRSRRSVYRIPLNAKLFPPVLTGPWGPPNLLYNGYRISFPAVKRPGRGVNYPPPPPPSAEVKERVNLYFFSHCDILVLVRISFFKIFSNLTSTFQPTCAR